MKNLIANGAMIIAMAVSNQAMADFDCVSTDGELAVDLIHENVEFSLDNQKPAVMVVLKEGEYSTYDGKVTHQTSRAGHMHHYTFEKNLKENPYMFSLEPPHPIFQPVKPIVLPDDCGRAGCNPDFPSKFPSKKPVIKKSPYTSLLFSYEGNQHVLECYK